MILTELTNNSINSSDAVEASLQDNPFGRGSLFVATNSEQTLVLNFLKQVEQSGYIQSVDYHFASFICHQLEQVTDQIVNLETINLMTLLAATLLTKY